MNDPFLPTPEWMFDQGPTWRELLAVACPHEGSCPDACPWAADCDWSDLDPGFCLLHRCYMSDPEHPHTWHTCNCLDECAKCWHCECGERDR